MEKIIYEIRDLILSPLKVFERLKTQETTQSELTKTILIYVAAIPVIAGFLGKVVIGVNQGNFRYSHATFFSGLVWAVLLFVLTIVGVYVVAFVVNRLSTNFGGINDELAAFKLTLYCFIPVLTMGIFSLIPALAGLFILGLYGIYLFYIGLPLLLDVPEEKALTFTVVVSLISIVVTVLFYRIAGLAIVINAPNL